MTKKQLIALAVILAVGTGLTTLALKKIKPAAVSDEHSEQAQEGPASHGDAPGETAEKGPHNGRLLRAGDFAAEVTIFERGVPPQFRVYFYEQEKPLDPAPIKLSVELRRLGGRVDTFQFKREADYLVGDQTVEEPHSFAVQVSAEYRGQAHRWEYESYEGRAELSPEAAKGSGLAVEMAGPARLKQTLKVPGRVGPNEDRMKHVVPRYPGVLKEVRKRLGEPVTQDEVLAVVESNESLQS